MFLIIVVTVKIVSLSLPGDENKTNGGSVEALKEHPFDSSKVKYTNRFSLFI